MTGAFAHQVTLVMLGVLALTGAAKAQTLDAPDVISRARGAERVVVATVAQVVPMAVQNEYGDQLIISRTTLAVEEVLMGSTASTLTVDVEGGTLGDLTLEVSDMPHVRPGDRGVFFVDRSLSFADSFVLHRRSEGILLLRQDEVIDRPGLTLDSIRRQLTASVR